MSKSKTKKSEKRASGSLERVVRAQRERFTPERALAWEIMDALLAAKINLEASPATATLNVIESVVRGRVYSNDPSSATRLSGKKQ